MDRCRKCNGDGEYYTPDGYRECSCKDVTSWTFGIPKKHKRDTFDSFVADTPDKLKAVATCRQFVECFDQLLNPGYSRNSILMLGTPGTGRTMLAAITAWQINRKPHRVAFWNEADLMAEMKAGFKSGRNEEIVEQCSICPLLVLDDLGNEKSTDFSVDTVNLIMNRRYQTQAPTIITTNLSMQQIKERFGERLSSRLSEMARPVVCAWEDYRGTQGPSPFDEK